MKQMRVASDVPPNIPTTGRTPKFLARRYGYGDLDALIADIPPEATVLDVGAGLSLLGHAVADKRPDITWVNIDPFYTNSRAAKAAFDAPPNVKYLADDSTQPSPSLDGVRAARIFSYWMFPHLSLNNDGPAARAAGVMWDYLADGGMMLVGPNRPYRFRSLFKQQRCLRIKKQTERHRAVRRITKHTRLPWWMRIVQRQINRHMRPITDKVLGKLIESQMRRARRGIKST